MRKSWLFFMVVSLLASHSTRAEETTLYCAEQHIVGMHIEDGEWFPVYEKDSFGRRYAIRFNSSMTEMSGVQGTETAYLCGVNFPSKAADVVTCINSRFATMIFNYSTENKRFLLSMVGPGGWLGEGTKRESGRELLGDSLILGECQAF